MTLEELDEMASRPGDRAPWNGTLRIALAERDWLVAMAREALVVPKLGSEITTRGKDGLVLARELVELREQHAALLDAAHIVIRGFDEGVFIRNTDMDDDSAWAIKFLPFARALAVLAGNRCR